jgi:hypothetical protein
MARMKLMVTIVKAIGPTEMTSPAASRTGHAEDTERSPTSASSPPSSPTTRYLSIVAMASP